VADVVEASERRLSERFMDVSKAREAELEARLRSELEKMIGRARRELEDERIGLTRIGTEIRDIARGAEERIAEATRIAEAAFATRAQSASTAAVRDITAIANEVTVRIEEHVSSVESRERLEDVLARLRQADERLRASDERTRQALRHLRAVPDESGSES
jgi:hypothetical protein